MSAVASRRRLSRAVSAFPVGIAWTAAGVAALLAISIAVRTSALRGGFWIDEGLSSGIASHSLLDIPGILRQDGSPPLYYVLLHVWTAIFDDTEIKAHYLSLGFGLLTVPAALWAGWSLFGRRAGWIAAALAAVNPFLTSFAQEARMYSLAVLLGLLACAFFLHAFGFRRRGYIAPFAVSLALLLYTHNWALFLGAALALAVIPLYRASDDRRALLRDVVIGFGAVALAYLPWVPTLAFQAGHTGAPWSDTPPWDGPVHALWILAGGKMDAVALLLAAGAGLAAVYAARKAKERPLVAALAIAALGTLVIAWLASIASPAWAARYFSMALGPLFLLVGVGLGRAGRLGLAGAGLVLLFWMFHPAPGIRSNAREVSAGAVKLMQPGDVVLSTHPEQIPVLHYYMPRGMRYFTPLGPVTDPTYMDWRDALNRLKATSAGTNLRPVLDTMGTGKHLLLVRPVIANNAWDAPWTKLVRQRSAEWARALARDSRFVRVARLPGPDQPRRGIRALLYTKIRN